jgi:hypothetical protein
VATTTYATLRQNLNKMLGIPFTGTTTGAGSTASLVSTDLQKWDQAKDDFYNDLWCLITSGTYAAASAIVSDYTASSGTVVPRPSWAGAPGSSVTFEVMPYDPAQVLAAFQRAVDGLYPAPGHKGLFRTLYDPCYVTGNWLPNSHMEDWTLTTIPDHWVAVSATITEETTIIRGPLGSSAMKIVGSGSAHGAYVSNVEWPQLLGLRGKTISLAGWVYASTTTPVLQVYTKGSTTSASQTSSSAHTGSTEYELLTIENLAIPSDLTDIKITCLSGSATAYFDSLYTYNCTEPFRYHMSKEFAHDPLQALWQTNVGYDYGADDVQGGESWEVLPKSFWHIEDDGTNRMLVLAPLHEGGYQSYAHLGRRKLMLVGNERLTSPLIDATTVEVAGEQMRLLVNCAAYELFKSLAANAAAPDNSVINYAARRDYWGDEAERMTKLYGMPMPMSGFRMVS